MHKFFERKLHKELKNHLLDKQVSVITGMRRVGKTTLVKHLLEEVSSSNKIFIDMQRVDNRELFKEKNYDNILIEIGKRGVDVNKKMYIAIDEIQLVPELPGVIKYLYDHYDIKFIITGSSSYYIKNLFSESLSGRKKIFELSVLDFGEFLLFKNLEGYVLKNEKLTLETLEKNFDKYEYERLKIYYDEYIEYGGFPEVVLSESFEKKKDLLKDIISSYIQLDVESLSDFRKKHDFYNVIKLLASRVGSRIDYKKISSMTSVSDYTLKNYMDFFEDTYLLKRVSVFTKNPDKEIVKAKKLYFIDTGLAGVLYDLNSGTKFENTIFNQLQSVSKIKYYALKNGKEIDFIINDEFSLEAKETPTVSDLKNLEILSEKASIKKYKLVGKNISPNFSDYIWGGSIQ